MGGATAAAAPMDSSNHSDAGIMTHCMKSACGPGGSCREVTDDYSCDCRSGYSGTGSHHCLNLRFSTTNDIATDKQTGLIWQRDPGSDQVALAQHGPYCAALKTAGGGWRVPTVSELESLRDLDAPDPQPKIDSETFRLLPDQSVSFPRYLYSTSTQTTEPGTGMQWYLVEFQAGMRGWAADAYLYSRVRCVR
jgi:hypothetical protein